MARINQVDAQEAISSTAGSGIRAARGWLAGPNA
jgi:hypothetical protein